MDPLNQHRGGLGTKLKAIRPSPDLFARIGGREVVERIVDGLYDRIAQDPYLRPIFHDRAQGKHLRQKYFFEEWMGGEPRYLREVQGLGTNWLHRRFPIDSRFAGRWLRHLVESMREQRLAEPLVREVIGVLAPMARVLGADGPPLPAKFSELDGQELLDALEPELGRYPGEGRRLLQESLFEGNLESLRWLLDHGVSVNLPWPREGLMLTPWCAARAAGFAAGVHVLERRGAPADIFSAAYLGDLKLLEHFAGLSSQGIHVVDPATDHRNLSPLHYAIGGNQPAAAAWLLERGAKVGPDGFLLLRHAANQDWGEIVDRLLANGAQAPIIGPDRWVLNPKIANRLLTAGADVNFPHRHSWLRFCSAGSPYGDSLPGLLTALVRLGAPLDARMGTKGALHLAAGAGYSAAIQVLLELGMPVDDLDADGETPLAHVAWAVSDADRTAITRLLLKHGADPRHRGRQGISPLERARRLKTPDGRERYRLMRTAVGATRDPDRL